MRVRHGLTGFRRPWRPSTGLITIPLAIIAAVTVIDINIPEAIHLGPFLVAAPAITASFAGPGVTAAIGALAVAAQVLIGQLHGGLMTANHLAQVAALFLISVLVTVFCYVRDRRERELEEIRTVATTAQRVLVRPLPRRVGGLRIASRYLAAESEAQIGGDLYAAVPCCGATRVVVGDVRGRGLPAVDEAASILGAFRGSAYRELPLPEIVAHLGNVAYWSTRHRADGDPEAEESFTTALVLDIHDDDPFIALVNCGHPPPLLLRDGKVRTLEADEPALPLGLTAPSASDYKVETFSFELGDLLLLYTDGVIEARDRSGAFYPLADRVTAGSAAAPDALVRHLHADLLRHAGGNLGDDAVIIAIAKSS
ncbi:PP2C family protein-serine/threonine phosphatase [Streptomyces angustmyceticus]|uniref:PP2C family protein-serine/threonine phosphatase n=1 Tax=Streptomyces angustmyceticus TaxID=285578 RepID=UPI00126126E6|nr:PP2C family protein-serine/threonine phosphatase [Streptomyces angustmyceticus]UAL70950.1 serine/threonine-protein phosphatase [Streptomyces angustmyceticus]